MFWESGSGQKVIDIKTTNVEMVKIAFQCSALFNGLIQLRLNKQLSFCNQCTYLVCIFFAFSLYFLFLLFNPETTNSSSEFAWGDGDIIGTVDADMPNTTIYDSRNQKNRYNSKRQVNIMGVLVRCLDTWARFYHLSPSSSPF